MSMHTRVHTCRHTHMYTQRWSYAHRYTCMHMCVKAKGARCRPLFFIFFFFFCLSLDRNSPRRVGSDANLPASRVKLVPTCLQGKHSPTGAISPAPSTFSLHTHYFCFSGNPSRSFTLIYWSRIICEEENWMGEAFRVSAAKRAEKHGLMTSEKTAGAVC